MSTKIIYHVLIGDPISQKVIWRYPSKDSLKRIRIETYQIFTMYCNNNEKNNIINKKNIINSNDGKYFFTVSKSNIFYLILANKAIEENKIFKLINNIESAKIQFIKRENTNKLYSYTENQLIQIIENFNPKRESNDDNQRNHHLTNENTEEKQNINITIHDNSIDFFIDKFEKDVLSFKLKISIIIIIIVILISIIFFPFVF